MRPRIGHPEHRARRLGGHDVERREVAEERHRLAADARPAGGGRDARADHVDPLEPGPIVAHGLEPDAAVPLREPHRGAHLVERAPLAAAHRGRRHLGDVAPEVGLADGGERGGDVGAARGGLRVQRGDGGGDEHAGDEVERGG
jgi:hypothetical protein